RNSPSTDPDIVAADMRDTFGIDDELREEAQSSDQFLRAYVRRVEATGILVLRAGVVESNTHRPLRVDEFRGFVISDELAPLVFINARDAKTAQIFTLTHEIAHLWFGQSGISSPAEYRGPESATERLCNRVAAESLVPRTVLLRRWDNAADAMLNLQSLAK